MKEKEVLKRFTERVYDRLLDEVAIDCSADYTIGINYGLMLVARIMNDVW